MSVISSGSRPVAIAALAARRYYLLLFALGLLVFAPVSYSHNYVRSRVGMTDFIEHGQWAVSLAQKGPASVPPDVVAHSGWQYLLIGLALIPGVSFKLAGFLGAVISGAAALLVLSVWFAPVLLKEGRPFWQSAVILLGVTLAAPIALLWPLDHHFYMGYVGITSYHNPTLALLRPFALLQFIYAYRCFVEESPLKGWQIAAGALASILAAYVKPSLALCILPAVGVLALLRLAQRKYVHVAGVGLGILVPTLLVLAWQFVLSYSGNEEGGIKFLPFAVMRAYSGWLGLKFLLSLAFPLGILVLFWNQAVQDARMVLAWLVFLFGAFLTYFFAEHGSQFLDGNFMWSGEIALMLLFAASTMFWLENRAGLPSRMRFLGVLWGLHVVFGIVYYLRAALSLPYA